jgi:hypothetical protein
MLANPVPAKAAITANATANTAALCGLMRIFCFYGELFK